MSYAAQPVQWLQQHDYQQQPQQLNYQLLLQQQQQQQQLDCQQQPQLLGYLQQPNYQLQQQQLGHQQVAPGCAVLAVPLLQHAGSVRTGSTSSSCSSISGFSLELPAGCSSSSSSSNRGTLAPQCQVFAVPPSSAAAAAAASPVVAAPGMLMLTSVAEQAVAMQQHAHTALQEAERASAQLQALFAACTASPGLLSAPSSSYHANSSVTTSYISDAALVARGTQQLLPCWPDTPSSQAAAAAAAMAHGVAGWCSYATAAAPQL
uniref:Uncharacterized protein n=1 Tax=Tetradesmus obliquus TaxID=3088 RepID=A0A383W9P7_TETOB